MKNEAGFGVILKDLRLEKGIGQVELASAIGVSKGIISLWENGKREPTLSFVDRVGNLFQRFDRLFSRAVI